MVKPKFKIGEEVYFIPTKKQLEIYSKLSKEYNKGTIQGVSEYTIAKDHHINNSLQKGIWYSIEHSAFKGFELFNIPEGSVFSLQELRNEEGELIVDLPDLL